MVREGLPELTPSDPEVLVLGRCEETRSVPGRGDSIESAQRQEQAAHRQGAEKPGRMGWQVVGGER